MRQRNTPSSIRISRWMVGVVAGGLALGSAWSAEAQMGRQREEAGGQSQQEMVRKLQESAPALGYIKAHKDVTRPFDLLGGPISISVKQEGGGVFVALPDFRELDPRVMGTPDMPLAYGGTPGITGVPPMFREVEQGQFSRLDRKTPFGDAYMVMGRGNLEITAKDVTATDAATTKDTIEITASWEDREGNTYKVVANKPIPHGMEFPTFGGVVTNHILHGFSGVGTPLMPSEYTYFAFWAMGRVMKNGEVLDAPRLVHGMLTEYVRTEGYELALDHEVTPTRRHFHLMVGPFMPNKDTGHFMHKNVKTGFTLPNGKELPFWHVMFETLDIESDRE